MKLRYFMLLLMGNLLTSPTVHAQGKSTVVLYEVADPAETGQAKVLNRMLSSALISSNKFDVILRDAASGFVEDQLILRSNPNASGPTELPDLPERADYAIFASITSAYMVTRNLSSNPKKGALLFSNDCVDAFGAIGVNIRIVDTRTGELILATPLNERQRAGTTCFNGSTFDFSGLFRVSANKIADAFVSTVYPTQVASVQADGVVVLNYGDGKIKVGNLYGVYQKGKVVLDPATGEPIGNDEERVGFVQVTSVQAKLSRAVIVGNLLRPVEVGAVARLVSRAEFEALNNVRKLIR